MFDTIDHNGHEFERKPDEESADAYVCAACNARSVFRAVAVEHGFVVAHDELRGERYCPGADGRAHLRRRKQVLTEMKLQPVPRAVK